MIQLGYILYIVILVDLVVLKKSVPTTTKISLTNITNTTMKYKIL